MTTPAPSFNSELRLAPFHTNGSHTIILQIILRKIWGIKIHFRNICNNFSEFVKNYFWKKLFWHLNIFYFRRMKASCRAWRPVLCPVVWTIHYLLVWTLKYKSLPTRHRWDSISGPKLIKSKYIGKVYFLKTPHMVWTRQKVDSVQYEL